MSKKNYTAFRLDDLTWGINARDYPSEIEDKQSLSLLNWNFDWNQLVTSKWYEQKLDTGWDKIWWITLDWNDVWHISDWTLYKNWTEQEENWGVFISSKNLPTYWNQFAVYLLYYITIDWVEYTVSGSDITSRVNDLISKLTTAGWYQINATNDWFFLSKSSWPITVTTTKGSALYYSVSASPTITSTNFYYLKWRIDNNYFNLSYNIDSSAQIRQHLYSLHNFSIANYFWTLWYGSRYVFYLKRNVAWLTVTYDISDSTNYQGWWTLVNWVATATTSLSSWENALWATTSSIDNVSLTIYWTAYTATWTSLYDCLFNLRPILIWAWFWAEILYNSWTTRYYILVYDKTNNNNVSLFSNWSAKSWMTEFKDWLSISTWDFMWANYLSPQMSITTLSVGSAFGWIVDINVTPYWQLVIDRDEWWASLYKDNLYIPIWVSSVWTPKAWTIYKGKIVLWWYWNDNIVFSQTSTPTAPLSFLNFSSYSAWWQSVSAWNKWNITWFKVWENWLYVFKDNEIWSTNTENDNSPTSFNFIFSKITSTWALNQSVITDVQQDTFYLDWKNRSVRRLSYEANVSSLRDSRVNDEIRELFLSLPEEQPLATSSFAYPNYKLSLTDNSWWTITYPNWKTYYLNTINFVYNVDKKSWTIEYNGKNYLRSNSWYFCDSLWFIYKDDVWNIKEDWTHISKEYTFWDDVSFKRYWLLEITWDIKSEWVWKTKELEIEVLVDDESVEIGDSDISPNKRKIISTDGELVRFKETIDLFDDWQTFKFKLSHNWDWYVKVSDVNILYRPTKIKPEYF